MQEANARKKCLGVTYADISSEASWHFWLTSNPNARQLGSFTTVLIYLCSSFTLTKVLLKSKVIKIEHFSRRWLEALAWQKEQNTVSAFVSGKIPLSVSPWSPPKDFALRTNSVYHVWCLNKNFLIFDETKQWWKQLAQTLQQMIWYCVK